MAAFGGTSNALPHSRSNTKILTSFSNSGQGPQRNLPNALPRPPPSRQQRSARGPGAALRNSVPRAALSTRAGGPLALRVRIGAARPARSRGAAETLRRGGRALRAPQPAGKLRRARAAASGGRGAAAGAAQRGLTHGGAAASSSFPSSRSHRRLSGRRGRAVRGTERSGASAAAARRLRAARL